ncbi:hypothetical protein GOBAR_AA18692 [Gossypium barbadense]|uniref:Uncharacterized protein n=1 Tax=Gossypium barbadense TaxID=3634 RepID=A0A2P5XF77_GOSBA|nr:hypothetical protein GOBAR_AA18692 [Gossypium barbadense]
MVTLDECSPEEQEHLERYTKKIKAVGAVESLSPAPLSRSYKDSLLKPLVSNDLFKEPSRWRMMTIHTRIWRSTLMSLQGPYTTINIYVESR